MGKFLNHGTAGALVLMLMNGAVAYAGDKADTVYHNGTIYTMQEHTIDAANRLVPLTADAKPVMAEVVAAKDGKIVFVGTKADAEAAGYFDTAAVDKIVDLKGKTMYPGFIDGHGHFPQQGQNDLYNVNLNSPLLGGTVDTIDKLVDALAARAALLDEGVLIQGDNYDDTKMAEMRHPTAADMDKASTAHPIVVNHISGHVKSVNSYVLKANGLIDEDGNPTEAALTTPGVEMKNGKITGVLFETKAMAFAALDKFAKVPQNVVDTLGRCAQVYAAAGVTTVDNGAAQGINPLPDYWEAMQAGVLNSRVMLHPLGTYLQNVGTADQPFYMDVMGWLGRAQLGWKQNYADMPARNFFTDGSEAVKTGTDITSLPFKVFQMTDMASFEPREVKEAPEGLPENRVIFGAWKILFDGSPQAYTAWMKAPGNYYLGEHTEADEDPMFNQYEGFNGLPGTVNVPVPNLKYTLNLYQKYGQSTEAHTNGSGAAEAWVTALEEAVTNNPDVADTRMCSIHGQTMERQHIERVAGEYANLAATKDMYTDLTGAGGKALSEVGNLPELMKKQNFFMNFFDNHVYFYGDRHHDIFFGPGRAMNISPVGWAEAYKVPYGFHNDTFVTPISPLRSITSAVTRHTDSGRLLSADGVKDLDATVTYHARKYADGTTGQEMKFFAYDHRINALQALHAVTINAAWQNKAEDRLGSIEVGKYADFTIMDKDVVKQAEENADAIVDMRIAATVVDDKVIYGVLPGDDTFAFSPVRAYTQPSGNNAAVTAAEVLGNSSATVDSGAALGAVATEATVDAGEAVALSVTVLGNGKTVSDLALAANGEAFAYDDKADLKDVASKISGKWWISDFEKPLERLAPEAVLEEDHMYIVTYVVQDGDQLFDADKTEDGKVSTNVTVASASGTLPSNGIVVTPDPVKPEAGSSNGGCTVGTNPAYELLLLLLAALGVTAVRGLRRRSA